MTKPTIINEVPINMIELKKTLDATKKRDGELNFRATKTEEYLQQFVTLSATKGKELKKKLEELNIPRLKPEHIAKIIDIMPQTVEDMKVMLQAYVITVTQDNMKKIIAVVKEYGGEK